MSDPACSDDEFIALWNELGGATALAKHLGIGVRWAMTRRRNIEGKYGITLEAAGPGEQVGHNDAERIQYDHPYIIAAFTDAHFWPDQFSPAFFIFCEIVEHHPVNWQAGFIFIDVNRSRIMPERVIVTDGEARWRGKTWRG